MITLSTPVSSAKTVIPSTRTQRGATVHVSNRLSLAVIIAAAVTSIVCTAMQHGRLASMSAIMFVIMTIGFILYAKLTALETRQARTELAVCEGLQLCHEHRDNLRLAVQYEVRQYERASGTPWHQWTEDPNPTGPNHLRRIK